MNSSKALVTLLIISVLTSCTSGPWVDRDMAAERMHTSMHKLTEVIVHDIFSPPVASRIYAYASIAAYEAGRHDDSTYVSLAGQLNGLAPIAGPGQAIYPELASLEAFLTVGKALIFSEQKIDSYKAGLYSDLKKDIPSDIWDQSLAYGQSVAAHILDWADKDLYKQTRTYPKYSVTHEAGRWQPTPPDYMEGIEPHWREIRTMVLDSAQQYKIAPPPTFSTAQNSDFYSLTMEVYDAVKKAEPEHIEIAKFWDCNPYVSTHKGHFMFATKKITPGGHWMGIAEIAAKKSDDNFLESARTYAATSIALFDAFIACWDEKYRSNLVRPETVINKHFDEDWLPVLQTPPFPEHVSGHSVISTAAAHMLTDIYGESFAFTDTVEVKYGLPERSFTGFIDASQEAAISRLYGGIHYMPAITEGVKQGELVAKDLLDHLTFKSES